MTDPKPSSAASRTSSSSVTWSRCSATGVAADSAMRAQAAPIGPSAPW